MHPERQWHTGPGLQWSMKFKSSPSHIVKGNRSCRCWLDSWSKKENHLHSDQPDFIFLFCHYHSYPWHAHFLPFIWFWLQVGSYTSNARRALSCLNFPFIPILQFPRKFNAFFSLSILIRGTDTDFSLVSVIRVVWGKFGELLRDLGVKFPRFHLRRPQNKSFRENWCNPSKMLP